MTSGDDPMLVMVTTPVDDGDTLADRVVSARLAACANVLPQVRSIYRWEGEVQRAEEALVLIKTTRDALDRLVEAIVDWHRYDVPEVVALPIAGGSTAYLEWLAEATE